MKKKLSPIKTFKILILLFAVLSTLSSKELEKVSLQLQWFDQFQFAGYYMAKEKDFYKDVGLDVEIKSFSIGDNIVNKVVNNEVQYATGASYLILDRSKGKKIRLLSATFQTSPLVMISKKSSGIKTIKDFKDKKIVLSETAINVSLLAMATSNHIYNKDMIMIKSNNKIENLISGDVDIISGYSSNEVHSLKQKNIDINIFNPKDYGFDFYGDILFTSDNEINNHPKRAKKFNVASIKGWEYAFSHIDETVELILKKYNTQNKSKEALIYEANELKKLAYYKTDELGHISTHKIQRIYDMYNVLGFVKNKINIDEFIFHYDKNILTGFTNEERLYLKNKKELTLCIDPAWMPFESFKNKEHIGLSSDYFKLFQGFFNIPIKVIYTDSWSQTLEFAQKRKCDIVSLITKTKKREEYLNFTTPLVTTPVVIATKLDSDFIVDFKSISNKKIAIPKNYALAEILQKNYPYLNIVEVENINIGLKKVKNGDIYGLIGSLSTLRYIIQKRFAGELKISGKFDENLSVPIGVRNDHKVLVNIFQKLIDTISDEQHYNILNKWMSVTIEKEQDYSLIWQLTIGFFIVLLMGTIFLIKQNRLKKELEESNIKLKKLQTTLKDKVARQVEEITKSTVLLETIFNTAKDGIAILDLQSNFLLVNKAYEDITGFSKEELYKTSCVNLTVPQMIEKSKEVVGTVVERGYYGSYEKQCIGKNDKLIDVKMDIILMPDKKSLLVATKDITKANRYKKERLIQEQKLLQQSRLAQMGEMISMIAHQWRQPLSAISTTAVNLQMKIELESFDLETKDGIKESNEYFIERLDNINEFVQNLTTTIDDFRNFYKPNKESVSVKLQDVIKKSLNVIRASLLNDNIEIVEEYEDKKEVEIYDSETMQVILNLLKNAQDNFKEKGTKNPKILITTQEKAISICDNGGGIPDNIIERIFDPYFSTKDEKKGTGLGLYMSKIIIEEHHNGMLNVENTTNGVCFTLSVEGKK